MTKPRSFSEGNAIAQNPGQQTRGMVISKTPGNKRGECKSSKPRATLEGNGVTWNPGQKQVPRRPRQQNPGYLHCSIRTRCAAVAGKLRILATSVWNSCPSRPHAASPRPLARTKRNDFPLKGPLAGRRSPLSLRSASVTTAKQHAWHHPPQPGRGRNHRRRIC